MTAKPTAFQRKKAIELLMPFLEAQEERRANVEQWLYDIDPLKKSISFTGNTRTFTAHLVDKCIAYGADEDGVPALVNVLNDAKGLVGQPKSDQFEQLITEIENSVKDEELIKTEVVLPEPPGKGEKPKPVPNRRRRLIFILAVFLLLASCGAVSWWNQPRSVIEVTIVYAPESASYLPEIIEEFNSTYQDNRHPVTGALIWPDEPIISVTGIEASSGVAMSDIVNAARGRIDCEPSKCPTIFQPSVRHWLSLANHRAGGQPLFDVNTAPATANAPVVIAIWEDQLRAIEATVGPNVRIGWEQIFQVLGSSNGWEDYGIDVAGRTEVYYGRTNPWESSTGLTTSYFEFDVSARNNIPEYNGQLTVNIIDNPNVQTAAIEINESVKHYSSRTTEFISNIAQGPEFLDFVALEENDVIKINRGEATNLSNIQFRPDNRLVAVYPSDGTFMHDHPMGIVNDNWVTEEQRDAASIFIEFVLLENQQERIVKAGFRPANQSVNLDPSVFNTNNGVDPDANVNALPYPNGIVLHELQRSWESVRKKADIMVVLDISGSMGQPLDKLRNALNASTSFLNGMDINERIGLILFGANVDLVYPIEEVDEIRNDMVNNVNAIEAGDLESATRLYDALDKALDELQRTGGEGRIRIILLLSDGADSGDSETSLTSVNNRVQMLSDTSDPILVIPIAYGDDADFSTLESIAQASRTEMIAAQEDDIVNLLEQIQTYVRPRTSRVFDSESQ